MPSHSGQSIQKILRSAPAAASPSTSASTSRRPLPSNTSSSVGTAVPAIRKKIAE